MNKHLAWSLLFAAACGSTTPSATAPEKSAAGVASEKPTAARACTELDFSECKSACDRGNAHACRLAADAVSEDRRGGPAEKAQIVALLRKSCDGGDPEGCRDLGHLHREGERVTKDVAESDRLYAKAVEGFKKGCDAGHAESCNLLGHMIGQGWGIAKNEDEEKRLRKQAIALHEKACPAAPESCATAADAMQVGFYVPEDDARANELLAKGCDANDPQSCFLLGLDMTLGVKRTKKDPPAGVALLRKACDGGSLKACSALAEALTAGEGAPKDPTTALRLFERACSGPGEILVAPACHDAAELRVALGEQPSSAKVVELERRACTLGFMNGCEALEHSKK